MRCKEISIAGLLLLFSMWANLNHATAQGTYTGVWTEDYCAQAVPETLHEKRDLLQKRIYMDGMLEAIKGNTLRLMFCKVSVEMQDEAVLDALGRLLPFQSRLRIFGTLVESGSGILRFNGRRVKMLERDIPLASLWSTETCQEIPPSKIHNPALLNTNIYLAGKYKEVVGDRLYLLMEHPDMIRLASRATLRRLIHTAKAGKDNIRLYGRIQMNRSTSRIEFIVYWMDVTAGDDVIFAQRFEQTALDDAEAYLALGDWAKKRQMQDMALTAYKAALTTKRRLLPKSDFKKRLALVDLYLNLLDDRASATVLLQECAKLQPNHAGVQKRLQDYGYTLYNHEWILLQDYRKEEGFVQWHGKWVQPEEKAFKDAIDKWQSTSVPLRKKREKRTWQNLLADAVKNKTIVLGMSKTEVLKTWGYPTFIAKKISGQTAYEQWGYADGVRYLYLEDGLVFTWIE